MRTGVRSWSRARVRRVRREAAHKATTHEREAEVELSQAEKTSRGEADAENDLGAASFRLRAPSARANRHVAWYQVPSLQLLRYYSGGNGEIPRVHKGGVPMQSVYCSRFDGVESDGAQNVPDEVRVSG
jgi:hypothetical protein